MKSLATVKLPAALLSGGLIVMPYVLRDATGRMIALSEVPLEEGAEEVDSDDPEVLAMIARLAETDLTIAGDRFLSSDLAFIRVIEDVVEILIRKGVLSISELPPAARDKMMERRALRGWLAGLAGIVGEES